MTAETFTPAIFESLDERLDMMVDDLVWWTNALKTARDGPSLGEQVSCRTNQSVKFEDRGHVRGVAVVDVGRLHDHRERADGAFEFAGDLMLDHRQLHQVRVTLRRRSRCCGRRRRVAARRFVEIEVQQADARDVGRVAQG